ncbi:Octanoyltransferase LipM [Candidatus Entotheonellaceae bacterium PAL068K]
MIQQQWRFIDTGQDDAVLNMALDEAILRLHEAGRVPPTLRVYGWNTPTLSLGYAQPTSQEVDLVACQRHKVTVVRRPTGGRAVLHDQEVTYSVVLPTTLSPGPNTLTEHYRLIGLALAAALQQLGLPVHLKRSRLRARRTRAPSSPACFAALSRYELSLDGKKIVGHAQKRLQRSLLQHGSIPLWLNRPRLFQCLHVSSAPRDALVQEAHATMIAVNEVVATPISPPALHNALRQGFATTFGIELVKAPVLPEEWQLAKDLQVTKYATAVWNLDGAAAWRMSQQMHSPHANAAERRHG